MFRHLSISDPRERWAVGLADAALRVSAAAARLVPGRPRPSRPARILLLRLERIGDLLMTIEAVAMIRRLAPGARIDLVVGSWNAELARLVGSVDRVATLDAPWLARTPGSGGIGQVVAVARSWAAERYDLAINFEGDIRSHALMALSRAPRRVGFGMAGGGPLLTDDVPHDPRAHTTINTLRLVERAFDRPGGSLALAGETGAGPLIDLPEDARARAAALLDEANVGPRAPRPCIGLNPGGERTVKLWAPDRFAAVGRLLAERYGATFVLIGGEGDRAVTEEVACLLAPLPSLNLAGRTDLVTLGGVLERLALVLTGDTGPMHLAAALRTPVVGVFGPSDPARWGPRAPAARAIRVDLPCSPCNRIRRPPARCVGHVPDCLAGLDVAAVYEAAVSLLDAALRPADRACEACR